VILLSSCVNLDNVKTPIAQTDFQPKLVYSVTYEDAYQAVLRTLEDERIGTISSNKDEGRIMTDYTQGESKMSLILGVTLLDRYKYQINLEKLASQETRIGILCTIEEQSSTSKKTREWRDVSKNRKEQVTQLEKWLYEKIENRLTGQTK
jgi:hypothetical protein